LTFSSRPWPLSVPNYFLLRKMICTTVKVPTWHEVKLANTALIALHLSRAPSFDYFYDLLVSLLKIHRKYDRLTDRVGTDEQTFVDQLKIVRVRMEHMSIGRESATTQLQKSLPVGGARKYQRALPPAPARSTPPKVKPLKPSLSQPLTTASHQPQKRRTSDSIPPSEQVNGYSHPR